MRDVDERTIVSMLQDAFNMGVNWCETYKGWFEPDEQQRVTKRLEAVERIMKEYGV